MGHAEFTLGGSRSSSSGGEPRLDPRAGFMVVMIYSVPLTILSSGVNGPENLALLDRTQPRSAARRKPRPFIAPSPAVVPPLCLRDALAIFCGHKYSRDQYLQNGFFSVSLLTSPPLLPPSPPFDHTPPAIGMCVRRSIRRQKGLGFRRRGRMSSGRRRGWGGAPYSSPLTISQHVMSVVGG